MSSFPGGGDKDESKKINIENLNVEKLDGYSISKSVSKAAGDILYGDVNSDGAVNVADALLTAQYCIGSDVTIDTSVADVDGSGIIDISDALLITQYYVGKISVFPIQQTGIQVSYTTFAKHDPAIAANTRDNEYGLIWNERKALNTNTECLYFIRINSNEEKLIQPLNIFEGLDIEDLSIIWTGNMYVIVWKSSTETQDKLNLTALNGDGSKIYSFDNGIVEVSTSELWSIGSTSVAWTGEHFVIAWEKYSNYIDSIYFARLYEHGVKVHDNIKVTDDSNNCICPVVVWNGSECTVAFQYNFQGDRKAATFVNISDEGIAEPISEDVFGGFMISESLQFLWNGSNYAYAFIDYENIKVYFGSVSKEMYIIVSNTRVDSSTSNCSFPKLVWNGNGYGVAWRDYRDFNYSIYFANLDVNGNIVGTESLVHETNNDNLGDISLSTLGTQYGIAWIDDSNGNDELYFKIIE